jgi:osmotically inducible protein OsmC
MNVLYRANATAEGAGRAGHTRSDDGKVDFQLSIPKEMGGPGGDGTNPEQLFAAGYAACFLSALQYVARETKTTLSPDTKISTRVGIGPNDQGEGFKLDIDLIVSGTGLDIGSAQEILEHAHRVCPYSNATRGNVDVRLSVEP